ncbi:HxlR family transcriptional regulator [Hydrogenivirga caldilitoris]|uniref:HxlR family transcriptional regulator n=1 Tax=Hydrogenivirga caldilitoris TaxID=246264 RepID=A0A497XRF5_9AQUI|nr:helix-turn-helix domain-containing protein [Hydrogenivirga caldilitoris]RLJ70854.1 HxlR family transcriptional regulator [Hydrogenivirga caldilitoris]
MEGRSLLYCKWAIQIVLNLIEGQKRPSELQRAIEGIRERVLYDRLSKLLKGGLLGKWTNNGYPKESYYYLKNPEEFRVLANWLSSVELSVEGLVKLFSCKWTLRLMENLSEFKSPSELKRTLTGISDKVLQERLKKLEQMNLIHREVLPSKPPRVVYSLNERGRGVLPVLLKMETFLLKD